MSSDQTDQLAPLRRFRLMAVRLALLLTALGSGALVLWNRPAAQGFLMGGIAGILGFWIMAIRLEKLANKAALNVKSAILAWGTVRLAVYGAVLFRAYTLDRERMLGLLGATAGIFVIRIVMTFLGVTGMDLKGTRDS